METNSEKTQMLESVDQYLKEFIIIMLKDIK